jgi:gliding motility-associated-like protein
LFLRIRILAISLMVLTYISGYGQTQVQLDSVCAGSVQKYGVTGEPGSDFGWDLDGGEVIDGQGTDTVIIHWFNTAGNFEIVVHENNGVCTGESDAFVTVRKPNVDIGTDREICLGDTLTLDAGNNYERPFQFLWISTDTSKYFGDLTSQYYEAIRTAEIKVTVTDGYSCSSSDSVNITVHSLPVVDFGMKDTTLCNEDQPFAIYISNITQNNITSQTWFYDKVESFNNYIYINPAHGKVDTLSVTVSDNNQCKGSDTMLIIPCNIPDLFGNMPNSFTPNDDQVNDKWIIPYADLFPNAILEVFDRWGRLVYRTKHVSEEPWDGKSKGKKLPMDSYYYVLDLNQGNSRPVTGTVNLIR